jgi:hypothetical protein
VDADATPAEQEITRIRALITRIDGDITQLTDAERAQIDQTVTSCAATAPFRSACPSPAPPHPPPE